MTMRHRDIPPLTGLRGAAAAWVVLFHLISTKAVPVISRGYLGVDVFFILSGYILSHVYAERFRGGTLNTYIAFLRARIARIYPLHLATLFALVAVVLVLPGFVNRYPMGHERFGASALIASVLLIQSWAHWIPDSWNVPAWSLSSEWLAYLGFPIFMVMTQRWRSQATALILAAACLGMFITALLVKHINNPDVQGTPGLLRALAEFACGCLIFRAREIGLSSLPPVADMLAVLIFSSAVLVPGAEFLSLFAFALILLLAAQNEGPIATALSRRPVVFLGEISYSVYLVHWPIIQLSNWISRDAPSSAMAAVIKNGVLLSLIISVSIVTYRFVELPARAWARSAGPRKRIVEVT